jgi:tetratricopeptide (TPR) repeat protein
MCLTADRDARPRDASAVAERMAQYVVAVQERLRSAELARATAVTKVEEQRKRHRVVAALAGSVMLLVLGGTASSWWWAWKRGQNRQQIDLVMNEAHVLQQQRKLRQAADTAKRAVALAEAGPVSADLREWVLQEAAALDAEADELEHRRQFLDLLTEERTGKEDEFDMRDTDRGYVRVFRSIDVDVDQLPVEQSAKHFQGWREEELIELAAALDDWAWERRRLDRPTAEWQRLVVLARAVDRDEWRGALRALDYLNIAEERDQLLHLAHTAKVCELPPANVELVGRALRAAGALEQAVLVLQEAQLLHPHDVWLNYELAETFKAQKQWGDAVRYYTAARSVRAEIGHALGHALQEYGKKEEAVNVFAELTRLRPANPRHHNCLGIALRDKKQLDEAIREYRTAIDLDPKFAPAHYNLGTALRHKKQLDEAIREYRTAIDLDPKHAPVHNNLGLALHDKKQMDEAIREFRTAIDLDPKDAKPHNNLGKALHEKKQLDKAIREFRTAIDLDPKDAPAHNNLGKALRDKKQLDEAILEHRTAIDLDPKNAPAHNSLGIALADKKQLDEAIREWRTAIDLDPKLAPAHYNLGNALREKKQLDEAICEWRTAIDLDPKNAPAHYDLGNALSEKKQLDEAIHEYRTAIDLDPKNASAHNSLGIALADKKQLDEAIREFRTAIDLAPKDALSHYNLGKALRANGQVDEGIREYRAAIEINPELSVAHGALGLALLQLGRFTEARNSTSRCMDLLPPDDPLRQVVSRQLQQCEQLLALDQKLAAILDGEAKPGNDAELLVLAQFCQRYKKFFAISCRFYSDAFDHDVKLADDMQKQHRYNAACAAALAGCGQGKDADSLDDKDRPRLRKQALEWLRADLALWTKHAETQKAEDRAKVVQSLKHWQEDPDLASVRDKEHVKKLPAEEQETWKKLWADVEAVLKNVGEEAKQQFIGLLTVRQRKPWAKVIRRPRKSRVAVDGRNGSHGVPYTRGSLTRRYVLEPDCTAGSISDGSRFVPRG